MSEGLEQGSRRAALGRLATPVSNRGYFSGLVSAGRPGSGFGARIWGFLWLSGLFFPRFFRSFPPSALPFLPPRAYGPEAAAPKDSQRSTSEVLGKREKNHHQHQKRGVKQSRYRCLHQFGAVRDGVIKDGAIKAGEQSRRWRLQATGQDFVISKQFREL